MVEFKIWTAGTGTNVITIPKWMCREYELRTGDIIDIDLNNIKKRRMFTQL